MAAASRLPHFLFLDGWLSAGAVGAWGATWLDASAADPGSVEGVDNNGSSEHTVVSVELDDWVP